MEKWLLDSESAIRRTLHKVAGDALEGYAKTERSRWILEWPGQMVLNCSQVRGGLATLCYKQRRSERRSEVQNPLNGARGGRGGAR